MTYYRLQVQRFIITAARNNDLITFEKICKVYGEFSHSIITQNTSVMTTSYSARRNWPTNTNRATKSSSKLKTEEMRIQLEDHIIQIMKH